MLQSMLFLLYYTHLNNQKQLFATAILHSECEYLFLETAFR